MPDVTRPAQRRPAQRRPAPARRLLLVLGTVLVLVGGLAASGPASASQAQRASHHSHHGHHGHHHGHHRHHARHTYLALGDSVVFGYRPPAVTPTTDYLDASNFVGYPELLGSQRRLRVVNASCPGETTGSFVTAGAQSNGCENSLTSPVAYRTAFPLHTDYAGTQLDFAVRYLRHHHRTRLVTLMIGANDLFICQADPVDHCTASDLAATVAQVESGVDHILGALRQAHYRHRLEVVSYYSLNYADPVQTGSVQLLDVALARAAARHKAVVADGFGAFQRAAAPFGGDSCKAGLLIALPSGGCDVHPTPAGQQLLADAVQDARH